MFAHPTLRGIQRDVTARTFDTPPGTEQRTPERVSISTTHNCKLLELLEYSILRARGGCAAASDRMPIIDRQKTLCQDSVYTDMTTEGLSYSSQNPFLMDSVLST